MLGSGNNVSDRPGPTIGVTLPTSILLRAGGDRINSANVAYWHLADMTTVFVMSAFGAKADIRKCGTNVR